MAADLSNATLVNNTTLSKHFGGQRNQQSFFTIAKIFYYHGVLNELILLPKISAYWHGEMNMLYDIVDKTEEDMLIIYNRNFSNYKVIALHLWREKERKFIIRAKDTLRIIEDFIDSGKTSAII